MNINDSNIRPELTFRRLVYLHMQQLTNFPYIEQDFDALTDYELLCLVVKYLNDVIDNSNEQNTSITNLYNAFLQLQTYMNNSVQELEDAWNDKTTELEDAWTDKTTELETAFNNLQTWIDNYFDNLDVQEEINNKLDEMLEDGVLEQIIEQFLQSTALWCFDTVASMKQATNLINGSYAHTLGYYSVNDGGKALYKVRTKTNDDVVDESSIIALYDNTLIAELILENKYMNAEVFGLKDNDSTFDNMTKLNIVLNGILKNKDITILFKNSTYYFASCVIIQQNALLEGNNTTFMFTNIDKSTLFDTVDDQTEKVFKFKGIKVEYSSKLSGEDETFTESNLIRLFNIKDGLIENCNFNNNITGNVINNLLIRDKSENIKINNCTFTETIGNLVGGNIWIWNYNDNVIKNIEITNCVFNSDTKDETIACYGNNGTGTISNVSIKNCIFNSTSSNKVIEINFKANTKNVLFENNTINYEGQVATYISISENADLITIKDSNFKYNYNNVNNNKYISASSTGKVNVLSNVFSSIQNKISDVYNVGTSTQFLFENNNVLSCKYCSRVLSSANGTINTMTDNTINFENSAVVISGSSNKNYCYIRNNNLITSSAESTVLYFAGNQYSINEISNNKITATTLLNLLKGAGYINYWIINNIINCTNLNILSRESETVGITPITSIIYDNNITGTLNDLVNINTSATNRDFRNNLVNDVDVTFVTGSPADSSYPLLFRRLIPQYFIFNAKSSTVLGYKKQADNNTYTTINIS